MVLQEKVKWLSGINNSHQLAYKYHHSNHLKMDWMVVTNFAQISSEKIVLLKIKKESTKPSSNPKTCFHEK